MRTEYNRLSDLYISLGMTMRKIEALLHTPDMERDELANGLGNIMANAAALVLAGDLDEAAIEHYANMERDRVRAA